MRKRFNQVAGFLIVATIGGCIVSYPIENRRISAYCSSITPGMNVNEALVNAKSMFGVDIWQKPNTNMVVVKSSFTYKTLCVIKTQNEKVLSATFSDD
jgi:hypothetical protein